MTTLQYLTHKEFGCCTTAELMQLSRENKKNLEDLKAWAAEEMKRKGIEVTTTS